METDDVQPVPSASSSGDGCEINKMDDSVCDSSIADPEARANGERPQNPIDIMDGDTLLPAAENGTIEMPSVLKGGCQLDESVVVMTEKTCFSHMIHADNGGVNLLEETGTHYHKEDGVLLSCQETSASSLSGFKRSRENDNDQEPSVKVIFKSLARDSRKKLAELLQQWSKWQATNFSSENDSCEVLESGEEIYYPALQVGTDQTSTVSFWLDNETSIKGSKDFISFDGKSVPLYDRGCSLALTSVDGSNNPQGVTEIRDAPRCFNCGSFNHSLKECPQPRDTAAVNNARKQHKSKRNQNPSSRNPSRYYQESVGGKYDGLRPGCLDVETRQLLGLGEFDPPPWLNRMREIGYPPGYLDEEDEDQPSGITIFGDEEFKAEREEGEIPEDGLPELPKKTSVPKKMSVEFPGVNAPIPESADESRWAAGPSDLYSSRRRSYGRHNRSDIINRGYPQEQRGSDTISQRGSDSSSRGYSQEQRWHLDTGYDEPPPPGCEPETPPSSRHSSRYGGYSSNYASNSVDRSSAPWSTSFGRSLPDRSRRSPLVYDGSQNNRSSDYLSSSSPR